MNTLLLNPKWHGFAGIAAAMLSSAFFGMSNVFAKISFNYGNTPVSLSFYRAVFATIVLFFVILWIREPLKIQRNAIGPVLLLGIVGHLLTTIFYMMSFVYIAAGTAMTLHFLYPAIVCVISAIFFKKKLTPIRIIVLLMAFSGILFFFEGLTEDGTLGVILALLSAWTWAFCILYLEHSRLNNISPLTLNFHLCVVLAPACFVYAMATNTMVFSFSFMGWLVMIASGVMFALALITLQVAIKMAGSTVTSILGVFEPIVGIIACIVLLGEVLTTRTFIGSTIILAAVALLIWSGRNQEKS